MHVLIATDGHLDAEVGAELATRLAGPSGKVSILSIVEVPRRLLTDLRKAFGDVSPEAISVDRETVDVRQTLQTEGSAWPGDDAIIDRYLADQRKRRTSEMAAAVEARGITPIVEVREGEQPASDILRAVEELGAEILCVGSHGGGLFDGLLGSVGTKLMRMAPCPVLLIRTKP
jgi:nucleotide-binding universal stress UspA family protein